MFLYFNSEINQFQFNSLKFFISYVYIYKNFLLQMSIIWIFMVDSVLYMVV